MPRAQQNDRSALCLLALLNLTQQKSWAEAENPLVGITPMMQFARHNYGKEYAPNTRETFRRQTMHQLVVAGIALYNPDAPARPVNSPKAVYQIEPAAPPSTPPPLCSRRNRRRRRSPPSRWTPAPDREVSP